MSPWMILAAALALGRCASAAPSLASGAAASDWPPELAAAVEEILAYEVRVRSSKASAGEIELGRLLFFDPRLSRDNSLSCATCHSHSSHWMDAIPRAKGIRGQHGRRNTPSLLTTGYYSRLGWDGRAAGPEQSARQAIEDPREMDQDMDGLVEKLRRVPEYERRFAQTFKTAPGIAPENVLSALAAFVLSLQAPEDSPFDRFLREGKGLSASARRGIILYAGKAGCRNCHSSRSFTDNRFRNIGVKSAGPLDSGRYALDPRKENWEAFRTPTLRNVERTPPYMHDGSLATLREVVDFYDIAGPAQDLDPDMPFRLRLSPQEKEDLVEFMKSLTSSEPAVAPPEPPPPGPPPALTPPGTGAAAPSAGEGAAQALRLLEESRGLMAELEAFAAFARNERGEGASRGAPAGQAIDPAWARGYCLRSPRTLEKMPIAERKMLQACRALAAENPEVCMDSDAALNDRSDCRGIYWDLRLARSLVHGRSEAAAICRQAADVRRYPLEPAVLDAACEGLGGALEVEPLCRSLARRFPGAFPALEECRAAMGLPRGESCRLFKDFDYQKELCPAISAFREAVKRKSADSCRDDYLCRLLMGDSQACEAWAARWKADYCGPGTGAEGGGGGPLGAILSRIEAAVKGVDGRRLDRQDDPIAEHLHQMAEGKAPLDAERALEEIFLLRSGQISDNILRAETLGEEYPRASGGQAAWRPEAGRLRADLDRLTRWFRDWRGAAGEK